MTPKNRNKMKTKNMYWVALTMATATLMTACNKNDEERPDVVTPSVTIPYTVTIEAADGRATLDPDNKTIRFAEGDGLYIYGTDIAGALLIQSGVGETTGATFSGELMYTGEGSPADDLVLNAMLLSAQQMLSDLSFEETGEINVKYPTTAYCASVNEAVQKYSSLKGTSTFGARSFLLAQQTAFLNFIITFDDGTPAGKTLSTTVSNGGEELCTADVTTTAEEDKVVARFVLPVAGGTTLSDAKVKIGKKDALAVSDATLTAKVYNVRRTQEVPADAVKGRFTVNAGGKQVFFSKGNLQATTSDKGTSWTWFFAGNQWGKIGNAVANTSINGNGTISTTGTRTVDLFGWSTSTTHLGINNSTDNNVYRGAYVEWGSAAEVTATIGSGWHLLTGGEWYYLFGVDSDPAKNRTTASGKHYCKAFVNDVPGVILLPDDWSTDYYSLSKPDVVNLSFTKGSGIDIISLADWNSAFVPHGAVFLPTTGHRDGTTVEAPDGRLYYWSATSGSSTSGSSANANQVYIAGNQVNPNTGAGRHFGNAVRLVRDAD